MKGRTYLQIFIKRRIIVKINNMSIIKLNCPKQHQNLNYWISTIEEKNIPYISPQLIYPLTTKENMLIFSAIHGFIPVEIYNVLFEGKLYMLQGIEEIKVLAAFAHNKVTVPKELYGISFTTLSTFSDKFSFIDLSAEMQKKFLSAPLNCEYCNVSTQVELDFLIKYFNL